MRRKLRDRQSDRFSESLLDGTPFVSLGAMIVADVVCVFIVFPFSGCDISPARPFSRRHKCAFIF